MVRNVVICVLCVVSPAVNPAPPAAPAQASRGFRMGFTPFPPDMTAEAVAATDAFIAENGDLIAHHFDGGVPWPEALDYTAFAADVRNDWDRRKRLGAAKKVLVSVTPLNGGRNGLADYRGEKENMPLPAPFAGKGFDDPNVRTAYLNYCGRVVTHFEPDYLAIGIEVNELIHHRPQAWEPFVGLYKYVREQLKAGHPHLPIFATITLHNLTNPGWKDRETQQQKIREFLPLMDIVGVSYYPFMAGHGQQPTAILDWIAAFTDKPLAITETGFPADEIVLKTWNLTIPGDPAMQRTYYETLLSAAARDNYVFVVTFLHRDYDALWEKIRPAAPEFFVVWKDCGLLDESGAPRPALETWKRYLNLSYKPHSNQP